MRLMVGSGASGPGVYLLEGAEARNLTLVDPTVGHDLSALAAGRVNLAGLAERAAGEPAVPTGSITPLLPVARPGKILCLGLNYAEHVKEGGYDVPAYPALFMRALTSLVPAGAPMIRPRASEQLDYEAELMVIVGRGGKHIAEERALEHVFGYTTFNDGSVRDFQNRTHQWTPGKNFDATGPVGPVVVTPDEVPPGAAGLGIECRVDGEVLQSATTADMLWTVAGTISAISDFATLEPGDLIAMGTPPGVGLARRPPRWLKPGETVEVEIEGIGVLANPVVAEEDANRPGAAM